MKVHTARCLHLIFLAMLCDHCQFPHSPPTQKLLKCLKNENVPMLGFHWGIGRGQGRQPEPGTPSWAWLMVHLQASRKWLPTGSVHLQGAESWASHSWRNIQGGLAGREGEFITLKLKGNESSGLKRSRTVRGRGSLGLNFP